MSSQFLVSTPQLLVSNAREYIQRHLPEYVEELRTLCSIDSSSYYKPGLDEMVEVLSARMRNLGMEATVFENEQWGNDLLGTIHGEGSANVLLVGHIDTVYPVGVAAERPLRVEGNTIYGPGASDMKGCVLSAIYAIEALLAQGYRPFKELRFLCVSDEEISTRHSVDLVCQSTQGCQAALVLEAAHFDGNIVSARKGTVHYKLSVRGRSAHAGVEPEKGRNATVELAHQITQIQHFKGWHEGVTVTPSVVSGGTAQNAVPDYAEVILDVRYLEEPHRIETEKQLRSFLRKRIIPDTELALESFPAHCRPMARTPETMELVRLAQNLAHTMGFSLGHMLRGGGSDACNTSLQGVPTLDGLGPIGGLDHSPDEYLLLDSVAPRTALLAGLIACIGTPILQSELFGAN